MVEVEVGLVAEVREVTVIGIDPDRHGGIAVLGPDVQAVYPMPTLTADNGRDEYNLPEIIQLVQRLAGQGPMRPPCAAFVERQTALPARFGTGGARAGGSIANWNRGGSWRLFQGLLTALGIPATPVQPQTWQRAMLTSIPGRDTKVRSILAARQLFPGVSLLPTERSRKYSHGLADALLIAFWGRQLLDGWTGSTPKTRKAARA